MAHDFKISDVMEPGTAEAVRKVSDEIGKLGDTYSSTIKKMAGGIKIDVKSIDDLNNKQNTLNATLKQLHDTQTKLVSAQEKQVKILSDISKGLSDFAKLSNLSKSMDTFTQSVNKATESIEKAVSSTGKLDNAQTSGAKTATDYAKSMQSASGYIGLASNEYSAIIQSVTAFDERAGELSVRLINQKSQLESVKNELKSLKKDLDNGRISYSDYAEKAGLLSQREREINASIQQNQNLLKNHASVIVSTAGSYQEMNAAVLQLEKRYKDLTKAQREGAQGTELLNSIAKLKQELKDVDETMGNHQRKVGDYAGGAVKLTTEIRNSTYALAQMRMEGKENTAEYQKLQAETAKLKGELANVSKEIGSLSSNTSTLGSVMSGLTGASGVFSAYTGAMQLMGSSSEDAQESQKKLQSVIAVTAGLTAVQTNLHKQSAVMLGIAKVQTMALAKAEAYRRLIQIQGTRSTIAANVAQKALNLVAKANPYVILATALITVVGALVLFANSSERAYKAQKKLIDLENAHINATSERIQRRKGESDERIKSLENERMILEAQGKGLNKIRSIEDKMFTERVRAHKEEMSNNFRYLDNLEGNKKSLGEYKDLLSNINKLKAAGSTKVDLTLDGTKTKGIDIEKAIELVQGKVDASGEAVKIGVELKEEGSSIDVQAAEMAKKRRDQNLAIAKTEQSLLRTSESEKTKLITNEFERRQAEVKSGYANSIADLKLSLKTEENLTKKGRQAINDTIVAYEKQRAKEIERLKKEEEDRVKEDNLKTAVTVSRSGSETEMRARLDLLEFETNQEIDMAIEKGQDINNILLREKKERMDILNEYALIENQKLEEKYAIQSIIVSSAINEELGDLEINFKKGLISREQYEKQKLEIISEYGISQAREAINLLEEQLNNENLSVDEREALEKQLFEAKVALYNAEVEARQNADDLIIKSEKEKLKAVADGIQKAGEFLNAFSDLGTALFDRRIQEVEDEQEVNQAAHEAEIARIEKLEETGAITKETAEARKRAAEDATAQKEVELAKKSADLQTRQAKLQKANNILQITLSTAAAIMRQLAETPLPVGAPLIAIIGALGAIQLATAIAQPIPKYAKGTGDKDHPGGLAVVGDGGKKETVLLPSGKMWITPSTDTLIDLPKGSKVFPEVLNLDEVRNMRSDIGIMMGYAERKNEPVTVNINNDYKPLEKEMKRNNQLLERSMKESRKSNYLSGFNFWANHAGKM